MFEKENEKNKKDLFIAKIKTILSNLKFNYNIIGSKLLLECIYEIYNSKKTYSINLKKEIYPILSKKYNISINNIKSNINYATTIMYYETEEKEITDFFGFKIIGKPKSKDIMIEVLKKLNNI